ncbi:MAG: metallophosphoesterase family protein [Chloroflexi bacterium OHK40]
MRHRILHISDLHVGPPFRRPIAESLIRQAHEIKPDLLVISGDFVQRADFLPQWEAARELLAALPGPRLVVPGNHDVPLFHAHLRLLNPLGRYRRYISPEINPVFERPGLVVVGASSAHGLTLDGGRITGGQAAAIRRALAGHPDGTAKVVVWHHPVVNPPGLHKNRVLRGSEAAIRLLDECDVELLLCGHIHVSYIGNTLDVARDLRQGTIICQSGTSTSRRGYGREQGKNSCNLIEIDAHAIRISQLLYLDEAGRFVPVAEHSFPRRGAGVYELPRSEREVRVKG